MINDKKLFKKIKRAKLKTRPELKLNDWDKENYFETFDLSYENLNDNIDRIDYTQVSSDEFINNYELPRKPCIITNAQNEWKAKTKWTLEKLTKTYKNKYFEIGEDNDGYSVVLKMKYYKKYIETNRDDSPLYLFDSCFSEHNKKNKLLKHYQVPSYFENDLFDLVERKRPPYRWFVMGPARSGTGIHIDPLGTSAWNALVVGHKRWCLFPTETPRDLVKLTKYDAGKQVDEGITWFKEKYHQIMSDLWPQQFKPIECVQKPGEIIFVPCGWWHVVLNLEENLKVNIRCTCLDLTIAVTQNYCSAQNFPIVWHKIVRGRSGYAKNWYKELKRVRPDLVELANNIDPYTDIGIQSDSGDEDDSNSSSISSDSSDSDKSDETDEEEDNEDEVNEKE